MPAACLHCAARPSALDELKSLEAWPSQLPPKKHLYVSAACHCDYFAVSFSHQCRCHRMWPRTYPMKLETLRILSVGCPSRSVDPAPVVGSIAFTAIVSLQSSVPIIPWLGPSDFPSISGDELYCTQCSLAAAAQGDEAFQRFRTTLNMALSFRPLRRSSDLLRWATELRLVPHLTVARDWRLETWFCVPVDERRSMRVLRLVHRRQTTLSLRGKAFLRTRCVTLAQREGPPFIIRWNGLGD